MSIEVRNIPTNKITGNILNIKGAKHVNEEAGMSQYIEQMAKHKMYLQN